MDDESIFIIDEQIINEFTLLVVDGISTEDYEKGERAQLFFEYLSYRRCNKKVYMIPSLFKKICESMKTDGGESLAYFKNYVQDGIIGESTETTAEQDTLSLYNALSNISDKVFIVSDKYVSLPTFKDKPVLDMEKLNIYLKNKSDFMEYIRNAFYGSGY